MIISKQFFFEASHILPKHPGKCANLHGHSWELELGLQGKVDPETNFVLDYYHLGAIVDPLIDCLDHTHLNFLIRYPSSENILLALGHVLLPLADRPFSAVQLALKETRKTRASLVLMDPNTLSMDEGSRSAFQIPDPEEVIETSIVKPLPILIRSKQDQWKRAIESAHTTIATIRRRIAS